MNFSHYEALQQINGISTPHLQVFLTILQQIKVEKFLIPLMTRDLNIFIIKIKLIYMTLEIKLL
jgi:hypothetical protein